VHRPFHATRLRRWLHRDRLAIAPGARVDPRALFSLRGEGRIRIGPGCRIGPGAILADYGGFIDLGARVSVNPYAVIYGHGGVRIGDDVRIAAHVVIVAADHVFDDPAAPVRAQGMTKRGITIGRDVWIGANVTVLDGVTIAEGCVIGAGAVVTRSTEPYGLYLGAPARRVRDRGALDRAG
jgi:acetyltransferase-like isoleucine patch superfamily enzyme